MWVKRSRELWMREAERSTNQGLMRYVILRHQDSAQTDPKQGRCRGIALARIGFSRETGLPS
jgi:hypothetical protein